MPLAWTRDLPAGLSAARSLGAIARASAASSSGVGARSSPVAGSMKAFTAFMASLSSAGHSWSGMEMTRTSARGAGAATGAAAFFAGRFAGMYRASSAAMDGDPATRTAASCERAGRHPEETLHKTWFEPHVYLLLPETGSRNLYPEAPARKR